MSLFSDEDSDFLDNGDDVVSGQWPEELRQRLNHALETWIASAYMDLRGVEVLEQVLKTVVIGQQRELRILLDPQFHENELYRQVVINRLYALPNVKVRLSSSTGKFHLKLYVFNEGSYTSCLIGSMNLTGAGMERNIEAGTIVRSVQTVRNFERLFQQHWDIASEAPHTDLLDFTGPKFRTGEHVEHLPTENQGVVLKYRVQGASYEYLVYTAQAEQWRPENELRGSPAGVTPQDVVYPAKHTPEQIQRLINGYLHRRYYRPATGGYYASKTSRMIEYWYQQIPLRRLLSASVPRLLIADEVGLGKTIEAGLIMRELLERMPFCRRLLIVCPHNLVPKWQLEMKLKFGLNFHHLTSSSVIMNFIQSHSNSDVSFRIIVSYESIGNNKVEKYLQNHQLRTDVLVCDEAHHLRTVKTIRHRTIRALAAETRSMLMLTATPINLGNENLRVLLCLLDPHRFKDLTKQKWKSLIAPNFYISVIIRELHIAISMVNEGQVPITPGLLGKVAEFENRILDNALYHERFADSRLPEILQNIRQLGTKDCKITMSVAVDWEEALFSSSIVAQSVSRTMKQDVLDSIKVRDIKTLKVQLQGEEKERFARFLREIRAFRRKNNDNNNRLRAYQYLRQASSCMPSFTTIVGSIPEEHEGTKKTSMDWQPSDELLSIPDSKYETLKSLIITAREKDGDNLRVIVFCLFHRTIHYLEKRLERDFGIGIVTIISGEVTDVKERYKRINAFAAKGKPHILLCSEVASEGIDLQFCNMLVNYDMPWNPTKLEQRIGRIDRQGQDATILHIFNLVLEGSVEELIYERVEKRLEDARNTLGPLADVLGELEDKLPDQFLRKELNENERKKVESFYKRKIERARLEEDRGRKNTLVLSVSKHAALTKMADKRKSVADFMFLIPRYIIELTKECSLIDLPEGGQELHINSAFRQRLEEDVRNLLIGEGNRDYACELVPLLHEGRMPVVLTQEESLRSPAEFLNVSHPVIRALVARQEVVESDSWVLCFETSDASVSCGLYVIIEYVCEIVRQGVVVEHLFSQHAYALTSDNYRILEENDSTRNLFNFSKWRPVQPLDIEKKLLDKIETESRDKATLYFEEARNDLVLHLDNNRQALRQAYLAMHGREMANIKQQLDSTVAPDSQRTLRRQLQEHEKEIEKRCAGLADRHELVAPAQRILMAIVTRR